MRRYLTGLLCCFGAIIYVLFYTLENRGASSAAIRRLRGASPRALISSSHGNGSTNPKPNSTTTKVPGATLRMRRGDSECDALLCGTSGVGKSTLLRNVKAGTVAHSCYPVPDEWHAFVAVWNFVSPRRPERSIRAGSRRNFDCTDPSLITPSRFGTSTRADSSAPGAGRRASR